MKAKSKILIGVVLLTGAAVLVNRTNQHPDCVGLTIESCQALTKDGKIEPCPDYYLETMGKRKDTKGYIQRIASNSMFTTYRGFFVSKDSKKIVAAKFFQDWAIMHM